MADDFHENDGLLDDDPALDYILYKEMKKENRKNKSNKGCLGVVLILLLPLCYAILHFTVICPLTSGF